MSDDKTTGPLGARHMIWHACGHNRTAHMVAHDISKEMLEEILQMRAAEPCGDCSQHAQTMWIYGIAAREEEREAAAKERLREHEERFLGKLDEILAELRRLTLMTS